MAGESVKGLTVVISPLQSLMKDQVDHLSSMGIVDAVTINGMLDPLERAEAFERVASGLASLLYISPESLRSKTIEKLLLSRNVVRFVIDEAHCFSAWGQDFRVDYLYIGDFIRSLMEKKQLTWQIPVSCFTATAKQKVIQDICDYFKQKLGIELEIYAAKSQRTNLQYKVLYKANDHEKYLALRELIENRSCPVIIYVSRTKRTVEIAKKLTADGLPALPYHGQMDVKEKTANQEAFLNGEIRIIVATSAFGMGIDKKDVGLVIHYDISDSLENYVQEAGRAGRDPSLSAECYVLFHENDLDKHFLLLNQTRLTQSEIQQVFRAIKILSKNRDVVRCSALEIARNAGWDESVMDVETRVKTAVTALETAGYIKRGQNIPRVYASSICVRSMEEASRLIHMSNLLQGKKKEHALRIMGLLVSERSVLKAGKEEAESRVDYIADILGIPLKEVLETIQRLKEMKILENDQDLTAWIKGTDTINKALNMVKKYAALEELLLEQMKAGCRLIQIKELHELVEQRHIRGIHVKEIKNLLYFWTIRGYIERRYQNREKLLELVPGFSLEELEEKYRNRIQQSRFLTEYLFARAEKSGSSQKEERRVLFSVIELEKAYQEKNGPVSYVQIQEALLYLEKMGAISIEGGFFVLYNRMELKRLEMDNRIQYKKEDYRQLNDFYRQKIQQIHIVGEYANMMVRSYQDALQFVSDYFHMNYKGFLTKYFKGNRQGEINKNITPEKYDQLFGNLSKQQREIIDDEQSAHIVVAAGPGSGKTRVLVHKLAALVLLDEVKYEQLLMLTFSRAAVSEFQHRMHELLGNASRFLEIKTFHSYSFDLLGKIGNLQESENVVKRAAELIRLGEVELSQMTKTVVVIDEAQDMDENEFDLLWAIKEKNENLRIIAVGDDDQNIFEFRGASSRYMKKLIDEMGAKKYELLENYRSGEEIVRFADRFALSIGQRLKNQPLKAAGEEAGKVICIRCQSRNMELPIARAIKKESGNNKRKTIGILTNTNEEAMRMIGALGEEGMRAKLIQDNEGFDLYQLAELRMFLKLLGRDPETPLITEETWNRAKQRLMQLYQTSTCLPHCLNLLSEFASLHEKKYRSDLEQFIHESVLSDFDSRREGEIVVSTIHKAKGREFDIVYLMMKEKALITSDEERRRLYVGMTRAKKELYLYYQDTAFDSFAVNFLLDSQNYPEPKEFLLPLSHRDVNLGFFKDKSRMIQRLRSGQKLTKTGYDLEREIEGSTVKVVRLSQRAREMLRKLEQRGYRVIDGRIRFIVGWWDKNDQVEYPIILPDLILVNENR